MSEETEQTMKVNPDVNKQLNAYRQRAQALRLEIGGLEITKFRLIGELGNMETAAQAILREEATRLGIPENASWSVNPDGTVHLRPAPEASSE